MVRKIFFMFLVWTGFVYSQGQQADVAALIRKIEVRIKSYPEYKNYSATAVSKSWEMDSQWRPQKQVTVTKRIVQRKDSVDETILRAVETAKGVEKDVTEKMKESARKQKEKQRVKEKDARKGKDKGEEKEKDGGRGGSFSMSNDQMNPFSEKKRDLFTFTQLADTVMNGKTFLCIRADAKVAQHETYEGRYYVDPQTSDVLMMDVRPSKNPKFVKHMRLKMEFEVMPAGYYVFKRFWMSAEAAFLVKKFRMEFEESHSDVEVSG
jgi:hypothetical protein